MRTLHVQSNNWSLCLYFIFNQIKFRKKLFHSAVQKRFRFTALFLPQLVAP